MAKNFFLLFLLSLNVSLKAEISVTTVDFLKEIGLGINAAGPLLVQMDVARDRVILANTITSSISIIDGQTNRLTNIPIKGRVLQHLKSEAMTINKRTGDIYLIGTKSFHIIFPATGSSKMVETKVQLESIAVDENTGNVFITGRESKSMVFYHAKSQKLKLIKWVDHEEKLVNLNQSPPPPIRKVIADNVLKKMIGVDGYTATLSLFDPKDGKLLDARSLQLTKGGRWHLAGYNENTHSLYLVIETDQRKVTEAAKINILSGKNMIVQLPQLTEGVGINYNPQRDEIYIPYDNHATVHVIDFKAGGAVAEIKIPAYGNDASAIDLKNEILYIASWAFGEIDVIDLTTRHLKKRITELGILPHTFNIAFNPNNNLLYIPRGATAVNGSFGAALCVLEPVTERFKKIYTGWSPIDLIELKQQNRFLVFNSEDQFAEVQPNGQYEIHKLPYDYPIQAVYGPNNNIYLSYGPHQSYWPQVYIWDAKDGIITIAADDLSSYDRRIPRQAHKMVTDKNGVLYFTQNNWGTEEQFLGKLEDEVRLFNIGERIRLGDQVTREVTQRILSYDSDLHRLYLVRIGEAENDASVLQIINPDSQKVIQKVELGVTATDLVFDDKNIYVTNFESNSVSVIDKISFSSQQIKTGEQPLKLCRCGESIYVINHLSRSLQEIEQPGRIYPLPQNWLPDNLFPWKNRIVMTTHNNEALFISLFDPETRSIALLHQENYPFGETRFDTGNASFYVRGQFGDALFAITQAKVDQKDRLWVTDFLSGKLFIIED